jgi:hypothetical protein
MGSRNAGARDHEVNTGRAHDRIGRIETFYRRRERFGRDGLVVGDADGPAFRIGDARGRDAAASEAEDEQGSATVSRLPAHVSEA